VDRDRTTMCVEYMDGSETHVTYKIGSWRLAQDFISDFELEAQRALWRVVRHLIALMRVLTPQPLSCQSHSQPVRGDCPHPIFDFSSTATAEQPPSIGHVAFCVKWSLDHLQAVDGASAEEGATALRMIAEEGSGLILTNIKLHEERYAHQSRLRTKMLELIESSLKSSTSTAAAAQSIGQKSQQDPAMEWVEAVRQELKHILLPRDAASVAAGERLVPNSRQTQHR